MRFLELETGVCASDPTSELGGGREGPQTPLLTIMSPVSYPLLRVTNRCQQSTRRRPFHKNSRFAWSISISSSFFEHE